MSDILLKLVIIFILVFLNFPFTYSSNINWVNENIQKESGCTENALKESKVVYLTPNFENGKNVLTQDMISKTNTYYVVQHDYDLQGAKIIIPEGCVLDFQGGELCNGIIKGNNTILNSCKTKIFDLSIIFEGSWNLGEVYPEWFGANHNSNGKIWVDCIIKSISLLSQYGGTVKLNGHIPISSSIDLRPYKAICLEGTFTNLVNPGQGYNTVIIKDGDFDAVILGSWCSMRNIGVSSSATNDSHDGVWVTGFGCILDNIGVNNQGGNGIKVGNKPVDVNSGDYLTDCCKFYNVKSIHNEGYGLVVSDEQVTDPNTSDANANTFYSLDIRDNKMGGIYIDKCIDNVFFNLATQVNGNRASEKPLADIYIGSKARGHYFYSPYCESSTKYSIYLEKGASDNCIFGHRSGTIDTTYYDANEEDGWNSGGYNYIHTIKGSMWRGAYVPSFVNFENFNIVNKEWKGGSVNLVLTNDGIFKINSSSVKQFDIPQKIVIKKQNTTDVVLDNISGALCTERFDAESVKAKQGFIVKNDRITNVRIRAYLKSKKTILTAQSTTNVIVTTNVNNISNGAYVIARLRSGEIPSGVFYNVQCTADNEVTFSFVNVTNSDISLPELQWDILALEGQIIV